MRSWFPRILLVALLVATAAGVSRAEPGVDLQADKIVFYKEYMPAALIHFIPYPAFTPGETWVIYFHGHNGGASPAPASTARLLIFPEGSAADPANAVVSLERPIPAVEPGKEFAVNFNVPVGSVAFPASASPGMYQVQAWIDSGQAVAETEEGNNSVAPVTVKLLGAGSSSLADLRADKVVFYKEGGPAEVIGFSPYPKFAPGEDWVVYFHGDNAGSTVTPATTARLAIYQGNATLAVVTLDKPIPSLQPGQTFAVNFNVPVGSVAFPDSAEAGLYSVEAFVDPLQAIDEAKEFNNSTLDHPVELVKAGLTDLEATQMVFYKEGGPAEVIPFSPTPEFKPGQSWVVYFHGQNDGPAISPATSARLVITPAAGGAAVVELEKPVPALKPGETFAVNFNVPVGSVSFPSDAAAGPYSVQATVDPAGSLAESNEGNNAVAAAQVKLVQYETLTDFRPVLKDFLEAYEREDATTISRSLYPPEFCDPLGRDSGGFTQAVRSDFRNLRNVHLDVQVRPARRSGRLTAVPLRWRRTAEIAGTGQVWANEGSTTLFFGSDPPLVHRIEGDPLMGLSDLTGAVSIERGRVDGKPLRTPLLVRDGRPEPGGASMAGFDLSFARIDVSPGGEVVVEVRNAGPGPSPDATLEVAGSDGTRLTERIAGLPAGGTFRAQLRVPPPREGRLLLTFQLRSAGDANPGNDSAERPLEASPRGR